LARLTAQAVEASRLFDLAGKVAVVVGGTKGLGQGMALALAQAGADVCVVGRGPAGLDDTAAAICALGRRGLAHAADVTVEDQVERLVAHVLGELGQIDILVNSQGIVALHPVASFGLDEWQRVMTVNLQSVFLCCQHVGRHMLARHYGKIINISSVRGFQGRAGDPAYAPSKGAVNQLTRSLAIEWGPQGINVNGLAPAFTRTAMGAAALDDPKTRAWVLGRIPMGRPGEIRDLFGPVVFLASDASGFINGHTLPVDGGWLGA
jgi:2-deoxy-D-gluconate 3-dehydrogenase